MYEFYQIGNYFKNGNFFSIKSYFNNTTSNNVYSLYNINRNFGVKHVTQKQRYMLRILHPHQSSQYKGQCDENGLMIKDVLPKSLLCTTALRKLIYANTSNALELSEKIKWDKFKCNTSGVRWHPSGSWRVQFKRSNHERNFFVNCSCYFSCHLHGFDRAKELAIKYRKRLEEEYQELEKAWARLDNDNL